MSEERACDKPNFGGKYVLVRNENLNEFLVANGANWFFRKVVAMVSPELNITQDGNNFSMKIHTLYLTKESNFTVNEDFEEVHMITGAPMKVMPTWDGNKLIRQFEPKDTGGRGKHQTHTLELQDDELIMTLEVDGIIAKRIFRKTA